MYKLSPHETNLSNAHNYKGKSWRFTSCSSARVIVGQVNSINIGTCGSQSYTEVTAWSWMPNLPTHYAAENLTTTNITQSPGKHGEIYFDNFKGGSGFIPL